MYKVKYVNLHEYNKRISFSALYEEKHKSFIYKPAKK